MGENYKKERIVVPGETEPTRLDKYLAASAQLDLSRAFIQHLVDEGLVAVDGRAVSKNHKLKGGEVIELTIPPPTATDLTAEDIPLDIIYDDEYLAVINKPAGMVVHPAPGNPEHTLVNALLHHFEKLSPATGDSRPGIIHRLDKNTSGLLLVAKDDAVARRLRRLLAERQITKIYQAVTCGHMPDDEGTIDLPIGRSLRDRKKMIVTNLKSREAITRYRVLERFKLNDLIEIHLVTGRTHQIRVHLAHLNRPVLGDPEYGGRQSWLRGIGPSERKAGAELLRMIDRQALHAKTLSFTHPVSGREITVDSDLPDDMKQVVKSLMDSYR